MTEWRIGLSPQAAKGTPSILGPLTALMAWQRLTEASQAAVAHGYRYGLVDGHVNTMAALERHGFMHPDCRLTAAGIAVARWMCRDD